MGKGRLEAFSDGVMAIIITIMVLEIDVPEQENWEGLTKLLHVMISYVLSFILIGVYWINHHHLLHAAKKISSNILWGNLNLLFWLSLVPFGTKWIAESHFARFPIILYSCLLITCGLAYNLLQNQIASSLKGSRNNLHEIIKKQNLKIIVSLLANFAAIPFAFVDTRISLVLFACSSIAWIIPSKAIEEELQKEY